MLTRSALRSARFTRPLIGSPIIGSPISSQSTADEDAARRVCAAGWGKVILLDLGLETSLRIDRPMQLGDVFDVRCAFVDVASGTFTLADAGAAPELDSEAEGAAAAMAA